MLQQKNYVRQINLIISICDDNSHIRFILFLSIDLNLKNKNMSNTTMEFASKKYSKQQLESMGVVAFKSITCRKIDINNPHFINYHLHDLISGSFIQIKDKEAYIIEMKDHESNSALGKMEFLIFISLNHRDRFALVNPENFKRVVDNKVVYEELLLTYLN